MPSLEDLQHRLRNYHRLQESLHRAMERHLSSAPVYLKLEARYGHTSVCLSVSHTENNGCIHKEPKMIKDNRAVISYPEWQPFY